METNKIMQSIIITSRPLSTIRKWNQLSQFRRTPTKVIPIKKGLSWLHFYDKPRVERRQQVKDQQSYMSVFIAYLTNPSSS